MEFKNVLWNKKMELARTEKGWTQQEVAEKLGVPIQTYGRWERGRNKPISSHKKAIQKLFKPHIIFEEGVTQ